MTDERRQKRSQDPLIALHYQLAYARHDGDLDALVLADPSGVVVAGAGAWAVCEELAAYAPLFAQDTSDGGGASDRMSELRSEVEVRSMRVAGMEVFLCARGGGSQGERSRGTSIKRAEAGVSRILRAA
jgi:hypothetical protein